MKLFDNSLWFYFCRNKMLDRSSQRWLELELVPRGTVTIAARTVPSRPGSSSSTLVNFQNAGATGLFLRIPTSPTLNLALTLRPLYPFANYLRKLVRYSFLHRRVNWLSKCRCCLNLFVKELYVLMVSGLTDKKLTLRGHKRKWVVWRSSLLLLNKVHISS